MGAAAISVGWGGGAVVLRGPAPGRADRPVQGSRAGVQGAAVVMDACRMGRCACGAQERSHAAYGRSGCFEPATFTALDVADTAGAAILDDGVISGPV